MQPHFGLTRNAEKVSMKLMAAYSCKTRHPWLIACDANMCPEDFEKSLWFHKEQTHVVAPKEGSTCRSKGTKGEWIERTYDYLIASGSLKGEVSQMDVVEDFDSRPHKAMSFVREKEIQEWNEQKLPKVLSGYSGGRLPGRSAKEAGREEEKAEEECRERQVSNEIVQEVVPGIEKQAGVHEDAKSTA